MSHAPPLHHPRRAAARAAVGVGFVGLVVCVLWMLGLPDATRLVPESSAVQFVTGVCLLLAAGGLRLAIGDRPRRALLVLVPLLAVTAVAVLDYLSGLRLGLDRLFVAGGPLPYPGRMAPNTAVALLLAATALSALIPGRTRIWALSIAAMLATLTAALALAAILGYAFDLTAAFEWAGLTRMALLTAIALLALAIGIITAAREVGRIGSWVELPWLASTVGVGAAGVGLLVAHALVADAAGLPARLPDALRIGAVVSAALLAGTVAQARHLRLLLARLEMANRRQAEQEQALRDSERRLQLLIDQVQTAVVLHAGDSSIEFANPSAAALLGLTRAQMMGLRAIDPAWHFVREDGSAMPVDEYPVSRVIRSGLPLRDYVVGIHTAAGAPIRWVLVDAVPAIGHGGDVRQVIVSFIDISERQQHARQLEQLATTDALTGLATRRHLLERAGHELARARRSGRPLAVIFFDIDRFKAINDDYGHDTGDRVLRRTGDLLRDELREVDLAARWGGEEFCVVLPDTGAAAAAEVAERLRAALAAAPLATPDGAAVPVTASFGVALSGPADDDVARVVDAADHAMYEAKRDGRDRVRLAWKAIG